MGAFTYLMHVRSHSGNFSGVVRGKMFRKIVGEDEKLSKVDLARLPPCKNNLTPHVGRVNYRLTGPTSHASGNPNPAMMDNNG